MEPWKTADVRLGEPALRTPILLIAGSAVLAVLEREVLNAGPRLNARCIPWFHKRNASGGASSVLDPDGRGTMGLREGSRAG